MLEDAVTANFANAVFNTGLLKKMSHEIST
jgi:hypothetical protein